jgi:hypothetical protein
MSGFALKSRTATRDDGACHELNRARFLQKVGPTEHAVQAVVGAHAAREAIGVGVLDALVGETVVVSGRLRGAAIRDRTSAPGSAPG